MMMMMMKTEVVELCRMDWICYGTEIHYILRPSRGAWNVFLLC